MPGRYPPFAAELVGLFEARGAAMVDIPVIQPADPYLDTAGEDLRRRIFLTESETGESLCLRPEFTIPVCRDHIARNATTPQRYAYLGEVFRQHREGGNEFFQAGIEDLGEADEAAADARSLADAVSAIGAVAPAAPLDVVLGDQAVFEAVLAALGLPRGWQRRLARAFGEPALLKAALEGLAAERPAASLDARLADLVATRDEAGLASALESEMTGAGLSPHAGRTPAEIARRLIDKAELASARLAPREMAALEAFLAIDVPLAEAEAALGRFAGSAGIDLDGALDAFAARAGAIADAGLDTAAIRYNAAFGRPLDYYTGLVYEIRFRETADVGPVVGGGRYDRLLTLLGAREPIPGVGFSIWLDRLAAGRAS
jgi:ATP phosphoribosyltransferase regulatory subunit